MDVFLPTNWIFASEYSIIMTDKNQRNSVCLMDLTSNKRSGVAMQKLNDKIYHAAIYLTKVLRERKQNLPYIIK